MAFLQVKNRATSSLASDVSDTDTTWTITTGDGAKFPASGNFHLTCEDEIVKCTARSGDALTVVRAQEGTSAAAHSAGKPVELRVTAGVIENLQALNLTTPGDVIQRGASAPERLAIGSARDFPRVNEAGNALEYVKGYQFGQTIDPWQWELDFFEWTTAVTGSGDIYQQGYGTFYVRTGTTPGSTARGRGYQFGWLGWGSLWFQWYIRMYGRGYTTNGQTWLKLDEDTAADPTAQAVGFRIDNDALKGIVHDGSSLTAVDLNTTIGLNGSAILFLKFVPGDKVYWYVNGVEKGNSANIPTTTRSQVVYPVFAVANGADSANQRLQVARHGWMANSVG